MPDTTTSSKKILVMGQRDDSSHPNREKYVMMVARESAQPKSDT